jgi:hypothetical protein
MRTIRILAGTALLSVTLLGCVVYDGPYRGGYYGGGYWHG